MRTGIYEPYRNHFPLKQSQVPACQQAAPRLPYGAYDPTKAKLRSQIHVFIITNRSLNHLLRAIRSYQRVRDGARGLRI